jgi:hypothetical protein
MQITRTINGIEYTFDLTPSEMAAAYFAQQYEFDKEDVETLLDSFDDGYWQENYGMSRAEIDPLVEDIASEMRRMIDKYDVDWDYARDEAVGEILRRNVKEE